jgi:hypothetical protein
MSTEQRLALLEAFASTKAREFDAFASKYVPPQQQRPL